MIGDAVPAEALYTSGMTGPHDTPTEAAEQKARRLASAAALARPVQHDINNLLTVVFANLELLKRTAAPGGPQRQLDRIHEAAKRLEGSTRAILSMIRRPVGEMAPIRLSELIQAVQPLLMLMLPTGGSLQLELEGEDPPVMLDRTGFEDALLATTRQAADALPRGTALRLVLETRPGGARLSLLHPEGMTLSGLAGLAALARAAGAEAEEGSEGVRLTFAAAPAAD